MLTLIAIEQIETCFGSRLFSIAYRKVGIDWYRSSAEDFDTCMGREGGPTHECGDHGKGMLGELYTAIVSESLYEVSGLSSV